MVRQVSFSLVRVQRAQFGAAPGWAGPGGGMGLGATEGETVGIGVGEGGGLCEGCGCGLSGSGKILTQYTVPGTRALQSPEKPFYHAVRWVTVWGMEMPYVDCELLDRDAPLVCYGLARGACRFEIIMMDQSNIKQSVVFTFIRNSRLLAVRHHELSFCAVISKLIFG